MDPQHLELARDFCSAAGCEDLLAYLGLDATADAETARAALRRKRAFFQSMQGNPKYGELARQFIKNVRAFDALLQDAAAYAASVRAQRARDQLPMLQIVIDSVLADGVLTASEEAFVRENAISLGISVELYEEVLRSRCEAAGVPLPAPAPPPVPVAQSISPSLAPTPQPPPKRKGATTQGWWDDTFSKLLDEAVPRDTRRLVDLATGMAWAALALLPERPQLEYLGIDADPERLRLAERAVQHSEVGSRVALMPATPDRLPIPDGAVDVVLCVRALERVARTGPVFAEAKRILRAGGRLICVEPDRAGARFWFNGSLPDVEAAFAALTHKADAHLGQGLPPADAPGVSLGPLLVDRMGQAGLRPTAVRLHPVRGAHLEAMGSFAERVRAQVEQVAELGGLEARDPDVLAALRAIREAEARVGSGAVGLGAMLLPLFLVVATND